MNLFDVGEAEGDPLDPFPSISLDELDVEESFHHLPL